MKIFFDTSAFAKRFIEEIGSEAVIELCQKATSVHLSYLCVPELISVLNRLVREKKLNSKSYKLIKASFLKDIQDVIIYAITPEVINISITLLEKHSLRTLDALQLACAVQAASDLFVSGDKQLIKAAKEAKINCILV